MQNSDNLHNFNRSERIRTIPAIQTIEISTENSRKYTQNFIIILIFWLNECPNEQTQNVIDIDAFEFAQQCILAYRKSDGHTKQCANIIPAIAGQMNGNDQLCLFVYLFCSKCSVNA